MNITWVHTEYSMGDKPPLLVWECEINESKWTNEAFWMRLWNSWRMTGGAEVALNIYRHIFAVNLSSQNFQNVDFAETEKKKKMGKKENCNVLTLQ